MVVRYEYTIPGTNKSLVRDYRSKKFDTEDAFTEYDVIDSSNSEMTVQDTLPKSAIIHGKKRSYYGKEGPHGDYNYGNRLRAEYTYNNGHMDGPFAEYYSQNMNPRKRSLEERLKVKGTYVWDEKRGLSVMDGEIISCDMEGNMYKSFWKMGKIQSGTYVEAAGSNIVWSERILSHQGGRCTKQIHNMYTRESPSHPFTLFSHDIAKDEKVPVAPLLNREGR